MLTIHANGNIKINNIDTNLHVAQRFSGTFVYTPETQKTQYKELSMPCSRYSLTHDQPVSGAAGRAQFESDICTLLSTKK